MYKPIIKTTKVITKLDTIDNNSKEQLFDITLTLQNLAYENELDYLQTSSCIQEND